MMSMIIDYVCWYPGNPLPTITIALYNHIIDFGLFCVNTVNGQLNYYKIGYVFVYIFLRSMQFSVTIIKHYFVYCKRDSYIYGFYQYIWMYVFYIETNSE